MKNKKVLKSSFGLINTFVKCELNSHTKGSSLPKIVQDVPHRTRKRKLRNPFDMDP